MVVMLFLGFDAEKGVAYMDKKIEELERLSQEDAVTGLLNRRGGVKRIEELIEEYNNKTGALIMLDGDYFKKINSSYGHQNGELVIRECARQVKEWFDDAGVVFRLGADEFMVFYANSDIDSVRAKILGFTKKKKVAKISDDIEVPFTFSAGVAMYPECGVDFEELMNHADIALYNAKLEGRACFRLYSDGMLLPDREQFMFDIDELAKGMPGGFFVYEASGNERLLYISDSIVSLYKCDSITEFREHVGNSFRGMVHPDELDKVEEAIRTQQFSTGNDNHTDYVRYRIVCKDGTEKYVDDFGRLVHDNTFGDVYYVFLLDLEDRIFGGRKML